MDKHLTNEDITSLTMLILGGHFGIFMVLLVAVQANARNVLVSPWYSQSAVFGRLAGQKSDENGEFGSISHVHYMGSTLSPMHQSSVKSYVCLSVYPALRPTGLVLTFHLLEVFVLQKLKDEYRVCILNCRGTPDKMQLKKYEKCFIDR